MNAENEEINSNDIDTEDDFNDETQVVGFIMDNEEYGLSIMQVKEIITVPLITKIPRAASFIEGIIDLRESVLPIVDLRKRFLLEPKEHTEDTRIIVVTIAGKECGIIVDSVTAVMRLANNTIESAPSMVSSVDAQYISGISRVDRGLIILLDIEKILSEDEVKELSKVDFNNKLVENNTIDKNE